MRFHYAESMTAVANYLPLAQAAEANGYVGFTIPDRLIYPQSSATQYSYTDDSGREFLENEPFVESFILAAANNRFAFRCRAERVARRLSSHGRRLRKAARADPAHKPLTISMHSFMRLPRGS